MRYCSATDGLLHSTSLFFDATATTEIYTLSLHDALPISEAAKRAVLDRLVALQQPESAAELLRLFHAEAANDRPEETQRSEEHTSELQSRRDLVCRLLLEKKKHPGVRRPRRLVYARPVPR